MLKLVRISLFFIGLIVITSATSFGQAAMTPFSYLGIGEYYGNAMAHNQGMAGVGLSNPQYFFLNNQNPALLVYNRFTVFEGGFIGERRTAKGNGISESNGDGNLNYLAIGFPIKYGRWSTSIVLAPYTTVNYRLNYTEPIIGHPTNTVNVTESGDGGINQFSWSNGVRITKDLSVGVKASYLFSSIENNYSNTLSQSAQPIVYENTVLERTNFKDFDFNVGVAFNKDSLFNKNYKFNIGLVYDFKSDINTLFTSRVEQYNVGGLVDSVTLVDNERGSITLPQVLGAGISFGRAEKWLVGTDFTLLDYTQFNNENRNLGQEATKGWKSGVGLEFTPDPTALSSYLKRVTYRTGVSMDKYPYLINGKPMRDFGINFGFSLPVNRISSIDIALKAGRRGNQDDNGIEETYFKLYFGVTFNDQWFIRRRFE